MKGKDGVVCVPLRRRGNAHDPPYSFAAAHCLVVPAPGVTGHPWGLEGPRGEERSPCGWGQTRAGRRGAVCCPRTPHTALSGGLAGRVLGTRGAGEGTAAGSGGFAPRRNGGDGPPRARLRECACWRGVPAVSCLGCHAHRGGWPRRRPAPPTSAGCERVTARAAYTRLRVCHRSIHSCSTVTARTTPSNTGCTKKRAKGDTGSRRNQTGKRSTGKRAARGRRERRIQKKKAVRFELPLSYIRILYVNSKFSFEKWRLLRVGGKI